MSSFCSHLHGVWGISVKPTAEMWDDEIPTLPAGFPEIDLNFAAPAFSVPSNDVPYSLLIDLAVSY